LNIFTFTGSRRLVIKYGKRNGQKDWWIVRELFSQDQPANDSLTLAVSSTLEGEKQTNFWRHPQAERSIVCLHMRLSVLVRRFMRRIR
jgi:hypothetical protein